MVAASAFYKYFDSPIERVVIAGAQPIVTFQNADSARNFGLELEVGHGSSASTSTSTPTTPTSIRRSRCSPEQRTVQTSLERPLAGQSKNLFNLIGEYTLGGFSARAARTTSSATASPTSAPTTRRTSSRRAVASSTSCSSSGSTSSASASRRGEPRRQRLSLHAGRLRIQRLFKLGRTFTLSVRLLGVLARPFMPFEEIMITLPTPALIGRRPGGRVRARAGRRACRRDQASPVNVPGIDKPVIVVTGGHRRCREPGRTTSITCCAARCSSPRARR